MPKDPVGFDAKVYRLTPDVRLRLRREGLSPVALLVLDSLVDHDWADRGGRRKGVVWPKVATLVDAVGYSERTVRRHIGGLLRAGLIARAGDGGRGLPAVVSLNWPKIIGENPASLAALPAKTRPPRRVAPKPSESENQQKAVAPASSACAAPPRRASSYALPDAVPPPPDVYATIAALFPRIGQLPSARGRGRLEPPTPATDRGAREAWLAGQWRRAREAGLAT